MKAFVKAPLFKMVHTPQPGNGGDGGVDGVGKSGGSGSALRSARSSGNRKSSARRSLGGFGFGSVGGGRIKPNKGLLGGGQDLRIGNNANKTTAGHVASVNSSAFSEDSENQENSGFSFSSRSTSGLKTPAAAPGEPRLRRSVSAPLSASSAMNVGTGAGTNASGSVAVRSGKRQSKKKPRSSGKRPPLSATSIHRNHIVAVVSPAVSDQASAVSSASPFDRSLAAGAASAAKSEYSVGTAVDSLASSPSVAEEEEEEDDDDDDDDDGSAEEEDLAEFEDTQGEGEVEDDYSTMSLPSPSDSHAFLETEEARAGESTALVCTVVVALRQVENSRRSDPPIVCVCARAVDSPASDEGAASESEEEEGEEEEGEEEEGEEEEGEEEDSCSEGGSDDEEQEQEEEQEEVRQSLVASIISVASPPAEEVIVHAVPRDSVR